MINYLRWLFFPYKLLYHRNEASPKIFKIPGWETIELISNQQKLKKVNKLTGKDYLGGSGNEFLMPLFGDESVFNLDGPKHRLARKIIGQSLTKSRVLESTSYFEKIIEEKILNTDPTKYINVGCFVREFTMACMCEVIYSARDQKTINELYVNFEGTTGYLANIVSYNKHFWNNTGRFSVGGIVASRVSKIDIIIYNLIENADIDGEKQNTVCTLKSAQTEHEYTDKFIRDNLVATMAAGYDTLASAMTWMLYWLSKENGFSKFPEYDDASEEYEQYLDCFIMECLRYCPPIEILPRKLNTNSDNPTRISSQQKNTDHLVACPCPHIVHHDSSIYNSPDKFDPSRFESNKYSITEFFPFGAATRLCLGKPMAVILMKIVLKQLHAHNTYFKFRKTKFTPIRRNVSLWPSFTNKAKLIENEK